MSETGFPYLCELCDVECRSEKFKERHLSSKRHYVEYLKIILWKQSDLLIKDKNSVTVTCLQVEDCIPEASLYVNLKEPTQITFKIEVQRDAVRPVIFSYCSCLTPEKCFKLQDDYSVTEGENELQLHPGMSYEVHVFCTLNGIHSYSMPIAFQFYKENSSERFTIVRHLKVICKDIYYDELEPSEPYKPEPAFPKIPDADEIIKGLKPKGSGLNKLETVNVVEDYPVPDKLITLHACDLEEQDGLNDELKELLRNVKHCLTATFSPYTYWGFFSTLLFLEEIQMQTDIRKYDMIEVEIRKCPTNTSLFQLEVPGLVESRPSLLKGDKVFVRKAGTNIEYEGYVHDIRESLAVLGFNIRFAHSFIDKMKFDVRFTFTRYPLQLMHRAIEYLEKEELWDIVFPKTFSLTSKTLTGSHTWKFFNKNIEKNPEQLAAVKNIILGVHRPSPYLLFGPPGTGKTVTVVESIKQIFKLFPESRILVAAPSNSATNVVAERILEHIRPSHLIRIFAMSYDYKKIPESLKCCSNYLPEKNELFMPSRAEIMYYRIVAITLTSSGRLVSGELPEGHFTHIFIDEAGHSLEPECLIPVAGLLAPWEAKRKGIGGSVIFSGDHQQLGPVIRSNLATKYGLGVSLLERLMLKGKPYQRQLNGHYNPMMTSKLLKNFRSHPSILTLPNELFYEKELQVCADKILRESLHHWERLPRRGFPIIFHGVCGRDLREASSPSYYNPEEIKEVVNYITDILEGGRGMNIKVKPEDIGVISPYRKQVIKIRQMCQRKNIRNITVGSAEEFQGQERLIIIISTVRSNPNLLGLDYRHNLGFLRNKKRFNVAVTRAKALLIIVGNPRTLAKDSTWRKLIGYCDKHGACVGHRLVMEEQSKDIVETFTRLGLADHSSEEENKIFRGQIPITQKTLQEEPRWREEL